MVYIGEIISLGVAFSVAGMCVVLYFDVGAGRLSISCLCAGRYVDVACLVGLCWLFLRRLVSPEQLPHHWFALRTASCHPVSDVCSRFSVAFDGREAGLAELSGNDCDDRWYRRVSARTRRGQATGASTAA